MDLNQYHIKINKIMINIQYYKVLDKLINTKMNNITPIPLLIYSYQYIKDLHLVKILKK
jgi:hypothetical protein